MIHIDCIYIINLTRSTEQLKNKLNNYPFLLKDNTKIVFFDGINGWDLVSGNLKIDLNYKVANWWNIESYNNWYSRNVVPGEIGCGLSHYKCLEDSFLKNYKTILILEEDFLITEPFPFKEMFINLPKEWSLVYFGRNKVWGDYKEEKIDKYLRKIGYSYQTHANLYSSKGIREILNSSYLYNLISWDEFLPAINGTTNRRDALKYFYNPNFLALGFDENYIMQTSLPENQSLTEENLNIKK